MRLFVGLVVAVLFTAIFRTQIRKAPQVFYVVALLLDVLLIAGSYLHLSPWFNEYFLFLFQSNTLAMGFFTIVMFTGALSNTMPLKKGLLSLRTELSIIASILCMGHIVKYGNPYLNQMLGFSPVMPFVRLVATLIALMLVLLLIPLAVTSVKRVRAKMSVPSWNRLQKLAYIFYGLIFIHIMLFLIPSAMGGGLPATISVFVYLTLGLLYTVLRIRQYVVSRNVSTEQATESCP